MSFTYHTSQSGPPTFQVLSRLKWLVVTVVSDRRRKEVSILVLCFSFFFEGYGGVGGERVWEAQNPNACLYICNMLVNSFLLSISASLPRASNLHIFFNFIHTMRDLKTIQISDASCISFIYISWITLE